MFLAITEALKRVIMWNNMETLIWVDMFHKLVGSE